MDDSIDNTLADWIWLGELAGRIVRDPELAEDARQSAWLAGAASQARPASRAQLFWALRRFVSGSRTADARRKRREKAAARSEALPSPAALIERGEQQQRIWNALRELPEPLCSTLLLYFQDGLSPKEIAQRSGDKVDTVRRRIQRGIEVLRQRLGADRHAGGLAALALAIPGSHGLHPTGSDVQPQSPPAAASRGSSPSHLSSAAPWAAASLGTAAMYKLVAAAVAVVLILSIGARVLNGNVEPQAPSTSVATGTGQLDALPNASDELTGVTPVGEERTSASAQDHPKSTLLGQPSITGRVILHEPDGTVIPGMFSGTLEAHVTSSSRTFDPVTFRVHNIPIVDGRFSLAFHQDPELGWIPTDWELDRPLFPLDCDPTDLALNASGVSMDDSQVAVLLEGPDHDRVTANLTFRIDGSRVELHAQRVPPFTLHVVDSREPSTQLDEVDVVAKRRYLPLMSVTRRDAEATPIASAASSPVTFQPALPQARMQNGNYLVRAPGFAWKAVRLNLAGGGEQTVALERGAELSLQIQGEVPSVCFLRIYGEGADRPLTQQRIDRQRSYLFTNLPTGDLSVRVELGITLKNHIGVAEETVSLEAGRRSSCLLMTTPPQVIAPVPVAGTLVLPEDWDINSPTLIIERVSATTGSPYESGWLLAGNLRPMDGEPGLRSFDTGGLVPGNYVAIFEALAIQIPVHVPDQGNRQLRLVIPPPAEVSVTVRDRDSRHISTLDLIEWSPEWPTASGVCSPIRARRDPGSDVFRLRVPQGRVQLGFSGREHRGDSLTIDAVDGLRVEAFVKRLASVRIDFRHGGTGIPWPAGQGCTATRLDSGVTTKSSGLSQTGIILTVDTAGRYRVDLPHVEGFHDPDPLEIELNPGDEEQRIVVQLKRS